MFSLPPFLMFALLTNVTFKTIFHGTKQGYNYVPRDVVTEILKKWFKILSPRCACQKDKGKSQWSYPLMFVNRSPTLL